jgi:sRNA-binding carbon storage regulator CsrA
VSGHLVLARKVGEGVAFTGPGTVKYIGPDGRGEAKLAFTGPASTRFRRTELAAEPVPEPAPDAAALAGQAVNLYRVIRAETPGFPAGQVAGIIIGSAVARDATDAELAATCRALFAEPDFRAEPVTSTSTNGVVAGVLS